ncbi:NUDIX hydrolase [Pseudoxanthomonas kalamensis DSM 18571]|uniref:NUDIX hydrolase n=1 Tax=Pseudoxanthomonas kalamensis TaxID=289483 RepID=UPI00139134B2|nr:NUDIX hydrolase [Pseudoxanthomonas kalamensis DSM 18571]
MTDSSDPVRVLGVLAEDLDDYAARMPDEAETASLFKQLLADDSADPFVRERLTGHFTASAWLVDGSGGRVLLTHHRKLGIWVQLGGHADGDRDLMRVALREAEEESGLAGLIVEPGIFDLDRHWIPEYRGVPAHWHYDVRYVVRTGGSEAFVVGPESHDLAWRDIRVLAADPATDTSLRRMADKWLRRQAVAGEEEGEA